MLGPSAAVRVTAVRVTAVRASPVRAAAEPRQAPEPAAPRSPSPPRSRPRLLAPLPQFPADSEGWQPSFSLRGSPPSPLGAPLLLLGALPAPPLRAGRGSCPGSIPALGNRAQTLRGSLLRLG